MVGIKVCFQDGLAPFCFLSRRACALLPSRRACALCSLHVFRRARVRAKPNRAIRFPVRKGAWPSQRTAIRRPRSCLGNLTFRSQRQRLSFLRRGVTPHPFYPTLGAKKVTTFNSLRGLARRSDGRSSPPAENWPVCIGPTAPSQADMGTKARWRKHICALGHLG